MPKVPEGDCHLCDWRGPHRITHLHDEHGIDAVDLDEAALLLGRDRRMAMNYGHQGKIQRVARGLYDRASVIAYRDFLNDLSAQGVITRPNAAAERAADAHQIAATICEPTGNPDWRDIAPCRGEDPDQFYPTGHGSERPPIVDRLCVTCPVRGDCLAHALVYETAPGSGWWGGFSRVQRRELRKRARALLAEAVA